VKDIYLQVIFSVAFGYTLAGILVETKVVNWIGSKTIKLPFFKVSEFFSTFLALYLISPRASHITASTLLKEGKITKKELFVAVLASNLPMRLMFFYRYYFPVLLPLIGFVAVYYALFRLFFDIVLFLMAVLVGKFQNEKSKVFSNLNPVLDFSFSAIKQGVLKGLYEFIKFALKFTPAFFFVVFLVNEGVMEVVGEKFSGFFQAIGFSPIEITYITSAMISPPVAYGFLKLLLSQGEPVAKIVGTMAVGNALFSLSRSWWMYLLPYYSGLYDKKTLAIILLIQAYLPAFYNLAGGILLVKLSSIL